MDHVCRQLLEPGATLRDIAERCGFSNEFYLSRRFKQVVGLSPSEFRARLPGREPRRNPRR